MKPRVVVIVVLVLVIVAAGAVVYFNTGLLNGSPATSSTPAGSAAMSVAVISDNLTVGFQSGFWQISLQNTGEEPVSMITVYLGTPIRALICSGANANQGLLFTNCPATAVNLLQPNAVITGDATGAGPGSGKVSTQYPVSALVTFANGKTMWENTTVTAKSG